MHSLTAFYANLAAGATSALVSLVSDQTVQSRSGRAQFSNGRKITHAYAGVADGTRVAFDYPSVNRIAPPVIAPVDGDGPGGNLPAQIAYGQRGLTLPATEDIGILATRGGAGATDAVVALWTTPSFVPAPAGEVWTVQATSALAGAAWTWVNADTALVNPLPAGTYAIIGARVVGANCLLARFIFPGQVERPGVIANVASTAYQLPWFRMGAAGLFGTFNNYLLPKVEALFVAAAGAVTIEFDIVPQGRI
jgi:hypothetical protein